MNRHVFASMVSYLIFYKCECLWNGNSSKSLRARFFACLDVWCASANTNSANCTHYAYVFHIDSSIIQFFIPLFQFLIPTIFFFFSIVLVLRSFLCISFINILMFIFNAFRCFFRGNVNLFGILLSAWLWFRKYLCINIEKKKKNNCFDLEEKTPPERFWSPQAGNYKVNLNISNMLNNYCASEGCESIK